VARAIALGVGQVWPAAQTLECPMADGGEGTLQAIVAASHGELRWQTVRGPLGQGVQAAWGWLASSRTAVIEMAQASGIQLLPQAQRDACRSSTWGTGELIASALAAGAQRIVLAIGGSATNDGGSGMLRALGLRLLDADGQPLEEGGLALAALAHLDASDLDPRLAEVQVEVAADVDNPPAPSRCWRWTRRWAILPITAPAAWARTGVTCPAAGLPAAWALRPRRSCRRVFAQVWRWSRNWLVSTRWCRAPT